MKRLTKMLVTGIAGAALSLPLILPTNVQAKSNESMKIQQTVKHMNMNEKLGQLYVPDLSRSNRSADSTIHNYHLGGVIMASNTFTGSRHSFKNHIRSMQHKSKIPLMVGTDQEGGTVSRLSINPRISGSSYFPSPQYDYHHGGMKYVNYQYKRSAKDLHNLGINWNYAPDADVANKGSFIYPRTFGKNAKRTAKYIKSVVPTIQHQKVAACLKHFPGYGSAADTHFGGARTNRSLNNLKKVDFVPFKAGINHGVDSIMVTHIIINKLDHKRPASLSYKDIHLLRNKLGFKGVIVSDSLQMGAVTKYAHYHHINADVAAIHAGNDMILSDSYKRGIPALKRAIKHNYISKNQINQSVTRILEMKHKIGIF